MLSEEQPRWIPLVGSPQEQAFRSEADILLYGGAAGGGKTDLALGLAITEHRRTLFIRREGVQLEGAKDRMAEICGSRDGLNSQTGIWRLSDEQQVRFAGVPNPGDEWKYQGNPRDLLVLDEAANLLESQARALMGWVRSVVDGQRVRTLLCSNPPTSAEGEWLITFFAPWLDPRHPKPAAPGDLRWFAVVDGDDVEVEGPMSFVVNKDGSYNYLIPPDTPLDKVVQPQSRSFIPSRIADNPFLAHSGYMSTLQALPEPLRSQMLYGDFLAGKQDAAFQIIPTAWVEAAMDRWEPRPVPGKMDSIGADVSRGGRDESTISARYGDWYAELEVMPGADVPDGPTLGLNILRVRRNGAPIHVDAISIGSSVVDYLREQRVHVVPMTGSEASTRRDRTNTFRFNNKRSERLWRFREALDPAYHSQIALPPDNLLKADLCAPTFRVLDGNVIAAESKERLVKRLRRSTDRGDAVINASEHTVMADDPTRSIDYTKIRRATSGSPAARRLR